MDREKRIIIMKEIEHWRRSKLLPEQYCDFLMNLYAESSTPEEMKMVKRAKGKQAVADSKPLHWLLLFGTAACISYVVLHFSAFDMQMQIGLFVFAALVPYIYGSMIRRRKPLRSHSFFGLGTAFMLIAGPLLMQYLGWSGWTELALYLTACAFLWLGFGIGLRLPWLHLCGWLSLALCYALLLNRLSVPGNWFTLELCWLPLSLLFAWLGWLFSHKAKQSGAVCLINACFLWFMPETYALLWTDWPIVVTQLLLLGKLTVLGALGFSLRKTWIDWVV
ncbi:hypothetical protein [Paenibacillus thermotolerans]|uniref:hypothetical protein n=1 Tax=Paenibacillus thermotolerans TaxID=3027807 RepID=UPI00236785BE|nr:MULTISPECIES: hypothetical protein [unclassified Paenibacillus]